MDSHYITKWKTSNKTRSKSGLPANWEDNTRIVWDLIRYLPHLSKAQNLRIYQNSQRDSLVVTQVPLDE